MKIISRKEAKALGLLWYFTGKSCKREHICERYVNSAHCMKCAHYRIRKQREEKPEILKNWRMKNKARIAEYDRKIKKKKSVAYAAMKRQGITIEV